MGLQLETHEGATILGRILHRHLQGLSEAFQAETVVRLNDFLSFVSRMPLTLELTAAQNFLFALRRPFPGGGGPGSPGPQGPETGQATGGLNGDRPFQPGALSEIVGLRTARGDIVLSTGQGPVPLLRIFF